MKWIRRPYPGNVFWMVVLSMALWAHAGGVPQVIGEPVGPYRVSVWTRPHPPRVEQPVHVDATVYRPQERTDVPVTDARISVSARHQITGQVVPRVSLSTGQRPPYYYEGIMVLPLEGPWQVLLDVQVGSMQKQITFVLHAQPASSWPIWVWVGALMAILLAGWWWLQRPKAA